MLVPNGVLIRECQKHNGKGLFATKRFIIGEDIGATINSVFANAEEAPMCSLKIRGIGFLGYRSNRHEWDCFFDHSDDPSVSFTFYDNLASTYCLYYTTLHGIEPGDELTINYRLFGDRLYKDSSFSKPHSKIAV